jgi:hypothetical protein
LIFQILREHIWSDELRNQGRMGIKDFVRERVLTFPITVLFLINLAKKSLQVSLNEFCDTSDLLKVTKQAFSKARKKLSPKTFILLNRKLVQEYYSDNTYSTWKGFRVLAVDGSDLQVPQTTDLKKEFGTASNQTGSTLAMAKISYIYDVFNRITLDAQIDRYKTSEGELAVRHIEAMKQLQRNMVRDLCLFDRGYPSLWLFFYLIHEQKDFVVRCTRGSCFAKVEEALERGEEDVVIRLYAKDAGKDQVKALKKNAPFVDRRKDYIDVRIVVVLLSTGEKEILITSLLDQKTYSKDGFKILYNYRWGAEENYKWHKTGYELENFSGQTRLAVEQDLFSLVLTANMSSILIEEAQVELDEEHQLKALKHPYKINKRIAIAILKDQLLAGILNPEVDLEELCARLKIDLKKNVCPVRPNRKFERRQKSRLKYGRTMRRCI